MTRRILLTNDDGIESPGLAALACGLASHGHDVLVVAPESDSSGASASIGRLTERGPITIRSLLLERGGPPVEARAVDASPGLIALAAVLGGFGPPPDFVLSGANLGANTGHSILHSGTVGAVLTAQNFGVSGMAVSMAEPAARLDDAHATVDRGGTSIRCAPSPSRCSSGCARRRSPQRST